MGGPYNIPRDYKGENKILFIFSKKSFIYTAVGGGIGVLLYNVLKMAGCAKLGLILVVILALIGFVVGTFKMPENNKFEFMQKTGGEEIDQVILRWIKFRKKGKKIYIIKEEEHKDE